MEWWRIIQGVVGRPRGDLFTAVAEATLHATAEAGRNELLRVASVLRADIAQLRTHAGSGPVNTALLRAAEHAEAFGSRGFAGDSHLYRATEAMAEAGRLIAPTGRPPCLFNPAHGPASAEVDWSPGGSLPRRVPVCTADAARIVAGQQPDVRLVPTDFGPKPYFAAGGLYADWILGWYASGQDPYLTARLLAGTALGEQLPDRIQARRHYGSDHPMGTFGTVHP